MLKKVVAAAAAVLVVAVLAGALLWQRVTVYVSSPLPIAKSQTFVVKKGTGFRQLVRELEDLSIITRPLYLRLYARIEKLAPRVKAGEYAADPGQTVQSLLQKLVKGETVRHYFTIVDGTDFRQLREALAANDELAHTLDGLSDDEIMAKLGDNRHAEGLFLAETYQFQRGMSDLDLLERAHKALQQALDLAWQARAEGLPYHSPYEALIMASIVEKETGVPEERPRISGVFVRRLQRGMRLQTDPTVIYGLGDSYDGNLHRADLRKPTAYNTYLIDGLPPTPIAMVGEAAIRAALHPEDGPWLYFVAKGDGRHQFSARLSEHNSAVRRYQLKRREDYRSTPGN